METTRDERRSHEGPRWPARCCAAGTAVPGRRARGRRQPAPSAGSSPCRRPERGRPKAWCRAVGTGAAPFRGDGARARPGSLRRRSHAPLRRRAARRDARAGAIAVRGRDLGVHQVMKGVCAGSAILARTIQAESPEGAVGAAPIPCAAGESTRPRPRRGPPRPCRIGFRGARGCRNRRRSRCGSPPRSRAAAPIAGAAHWRCRRG